MDQSPFEAHRPEIKEIIINIILNFFLILNFLNYYFLNT